MHGFFGHTHAPTLSTYIQHLIFINHVTSITPTTQQPHTTPPVTPHLTQHLSHNTCTTPSIFALSQTPRSDGIIGEDEVHAGGDLLRALARIGRQGRGCGGRSGGGEGRGAGGGVGRGEGGEGDGSCLAAAGGAVGGEVLSGTGEGRNRTSLEAAVMGQMKAYAGSDGQLSKGELLRWIQNTRRQNTQRQAKSGATGGGQGGSGGGEGGSSQGGQSGQGNRRGNTAAATSESSSAVSGAAASVAASAAARAAAAAAAAVEAAAEAAAEAEADDIVSYELDRWDTDGDARISRAEHERWQQQWDEPWDQPAENKAGGDTLTATTITTSTSVSKRVAPHIGTANDADTAAGGGEKGGAAAALGRHLSEGKRDSDRARFMAVDDDGNGMLDRKELASFLFPRPEHEAESEAELLFLQVDADADARLNVTEVMNHVIAFEALVPRLVDGGGGDGGG